MSGAEHAIIHSFSTLDATTAGRTASQILIGWIPGWGNAFNAATAASLTEAVGWLAVEWFEKNRPLLDADR